MSLSATMWRGIVPAGKTHYMIVPWGGGEVAVTATANIETVITLTAISGRKPKDSTEWLDYQIKAIRERAWHEL